MDFPLNIALLTSFITIFILLKVFKASKRNEVKLPPGPWRLPMIGNLHQLAGYELPHSRLRQLADKYGPLMYLQLGQVSTVVISSSEAAKEVTKTHDEIFANRPSILLGQILLYDSTDIAFSPYGDYWRKLRNICMLELLSPKRVQSYRRLREEVVTNCMKSIGQESGNTIDLTEKIFNMTNNIVARAALGIKGKDQEAFAKTIGEAIKVASESGAADLFPSVKLVEFITGIRRRLEKMFEKSDKMIEDIINDHRAKRDARRDTEESTKATKNEEEDLVDVLLKFEDDTRSEFSLTTKNIKGVLMDIWMAGIDTSAGTIEWAMAEMLKNPDIMRKAQAEVRRVYQGNDTVDESNLNKLEYLKLVIKETLRLHPSLPLLLPRESSDQCQIFGYDIPPKTRAIINAWAIGRDPQVWKNPEIFHPERFLDSSIDYKGTSYELIPFGAGRRTCPGLSYALAVVQIQLAMFLYHFDWKLPNGVNPEGLDMSETFGISARRKDTLRVVPVPYPSSFVSRMI